MKLKKINIKEILHYFPTFYEKNKKFYIIMDDEKREIGIFGVKQIFEKIKEFAEISIYIFKEYRYHTQYKKLLKCILDFPYLINENFKYILIHTKEDSVRTLFKACKKLQVFPLENTDETWFYRKIR